MELYLSLNSGNSSRAVFALNESGIAWTERELDVRGGENRAAKYLAVNPMGKVPTLVHKELILWESNAINWYIASCYPESNLLPRSLEDQASVQRWQYFQAGHVTPACIAVYRQTNVRVQSFWKVQGDEQTAEAGRKELARYFPVLESALKGKLWLNGEFSIADIAFAPHLWLLAEGGFDFNDFLAVKAWLERLWGRPAWQKTVHRIFDS